MKRNSLRVFGCCLLTALLGAIGGGIILAVAAWVLSRIISKVMHQASKRLQDCDCEEGSEISQ
jgi:hypothetical protein